MELTHERHGDSSRRPIVLVHGITERGETWRPLVEPLAADHDLLVVDLRGHGASPDGPGHDPLTLAADVHDTVVAAGWGSSRPLLIGHSLGGIVVSAAAAAFPSRGVVNVDQPLRLASFQESLGQLEPMLRGDRASFDQAIGLVFSMMMGPLAGAEADRVASLRRAEPEVVLDIWGTVFDSTPAELDAQVEALAAGITVPYLSLHGIDPGAEYLDWLAGLLPTSTAEVWADHGHYPHLVDPSRFLDTVRRFDATL